MNCDITSLAQASRCLHSCIPQGLLPYVRLVTLCSWASHATPPNLPSVPQNVQFDAANSWWSNVIIKWTNGTNPGSSTEIWRSTDGVNFSLFNTVLSAVTQNVDTIGMQIGDVWSYKVRSCNGMVCSAFSPVVTVNNQFPVTSGLLIENEAEWDSSTGGTGITNWSDKSGNGRAWTATFGGVVDKVNTASGHATMSLTGTPQFTQTSNFGASGFTGMEIMMVYKHATDPPIDPGDGTNVGGLVTFNQNDNSATHQPWQDDHFYENFGTATRLDLGTAGVNTATAFVLYNVAVAGDGTAYDAWMNNTNFFHATTGYTFNQQGLVDKPGGLSPGYKLGWAIFVGLKSYFFSGNAAAVYCWNRRLTSAERTSMRAFIKFNYSVNVS